MVNVKLLHNNFIVNLEAPGKPVIKSSASGMMFFNSMELLCVALGSCIGKHLVRHCAQNKINIELFESIAIDMNNNDFIVNAQYPKIVTEEQLKDIEYVITHCDISKLLTSEIKVNFSLNKIDPDITRTRKPCCGG